MSQTVSISGGGNASVVVYGNGTVYAGNGQDNITISGNGKVIAGNGNDTITIGTGQYDANGIWHGKGDGTVSAGSGNDAVMLHAKGDMSVGGGNDTLTLCLGGKITQIGSQGHDTIDLNLGNTTIYEQGQATVRGNTTVGTFGSATVVGGQLDIIHSHGVTEDIAVSGKMTLMGTNAPTEFVGGKGSSVFQGGSSNDTFVGGSGHDTMIGGGGGGKNLFEFLQSETGGQHVISNFVAGDKLYIEGHSLSYLQSHNDISTHGGNTYISIDGGQTTIELKGFTGLNSSDVTTHK
jgi:Ca2+-binding RTX toxin-like protein